MGTVVWGLVGLVDMQAVEDRVKVTKATDAVVQQGIREDLVITAVKFLENSKVQSSTEKMKRDFLTKKGLTEAEIDNAFSRVSQVVPLEQVKPIQYVASTQQQIIPQSSFGAKLRDLLNILLLIGGASYAARYLWKKYISPWLFGAAKAVKTPHEMVLETTQAVLKTVEQLQKSVQSLQASLDTHSNRLDMVTRAQVKPEETGAMQELKSEIQSVKGLLLSSRSFPQNPTISPPSIPAWQLETEETDVGPDLVADTVDITEEGEKEENQSASLSNASEIEVINPDPESQENSSEDGH